MDNLDFRYKVLVNVLNCNQKIISRLQYGANIIVEMYGSKFRSHTILIIIREHRKNKRLDLNSNLHS